MANFDENDFLGRVNDCLADLDSGGQDYLRGRETAIALHAELELRRFVCHIRDEHSYCPVCKKLKDGVMHGAGEARRCDDCDRKRKELRTEAGA